jgi:hypothetical protein
VITNSRKISFYQFRSQSSRYNCLFGGIATQGLWLSSSLIRCPTPPRARPEKHAFNVVPYGTSEYVPYEDDKTVICFTVKN